ncbi:quinone-dependent dihydroorotate dehydrogenase [Thermoflexibacter ruber]|uniref:Dihydroorotate dehydrogenase (quinone) n=1 Tax=Thermoflexibacter ruber TaxID=1003 RepID=A0A1I2GQT0_9BACT|nr:quinone-dependent dihydroorotate dehydrogenase [Thermoflexibacter ruber]SFF18951.1 dihydroorotate oxidase A [Thermoflexibacter ruber]
MYQHIFRPILFLLSAETAHRLTFQLLKILFQIPFTKNIVKWLYYFESPTLERNLLGLRFKNPIGLAAGFDKNAELVETFDSLGFGFVEIGTVTPKAQEGNPKPRLFRLLEDEAIINRMGFNNEGVEKIVERLRKRTSQVIVGGNIGKNKTTPNEQAIQDYEMAFEALHDFVDYFVVNVSSPNTPNLRELQDKEPLKHLLKTLKEKNQQKAKPKPILLKIAPDLNDSQLHDIVEIVKETGIEGIVATNTTISRENLHTQQAKIEAIGAGGLSGKPLKQRSTEIIRFLRSKLDKSFVIIGVGGIFTAKDAIEKLEAGADLVQIYTGFVYEGAGIVKEIKRGISQYFRN